MVLIAGPLSGLIVQPVVGPSSYYATVATSNCYFPTRCPVGHFSLQIRPQAAFHCHRLFDLLFLLLSTWIPRAYCVYRGVERRYCASCHTHMTYPL